MGRIYKTSRAPIFTEDGDLNVTSPFGWRRDPVDPSRSGGHSGIDLTRWTGFSNVSGIAAFAFGTVIDVYDAVDGFDAVNSTGNYVVLDHGGGWVSRYLHLARGTVSVSPGEVVEGGGYIGEMGSTGYSTGAHLHFQLEQDGVPVDPLPYLLGEADIKTPSGVPFDSEPADWAREAVKWAKEGGLLFGDGEGNLCLRDPCTREMMCVFLHRLSGILGAHRD